MADTPNPFYTNALTMTRNRHGIWRATFPVEGKWHYENNAEKSFGEGNKLADARLKEVLDLLDSQDKKWPWGKGLTDNEDFLVTWKADGNVMGVSQLYATDVVMGVQAYNVAMAYLNPKKQESLAQAKNDLRDSVNGDLPSGLVVKWEHLPAEREWMLTGHVTNVVDGDTIDVKIASANANLVSWDASHDPDNQVFAISNTVRVRFRGIQTPETQKAGDDDAYRNERIARKYKVDDQVIFEVGDEAKKATQAMMNLGNKFVVIDIDSKGDGSLQMDDYGRFVGVVFKSSYNTDWAQDPMTPDDWYINVNKTLIASPSLQIYGDGKHIPLADVDNPYTYGNNDTRYDIVTWETTVAYGAEDKVQEILEADAAALAQREAEVQAELDKLRSNNSQTKRVVDEYTLTGKETIDAIVKQYASQGITISRELIISANNLFPNDQGEYELPPGMVLLIPRAEIVPAGDPGAVGEKGTIQFEMKYGEVLDNTLDFVPPLDDRRDPVTPNHVRIGDVQFIIPPLSITTSRVSSIEKVKTLRTKSSMITKAGSSHKTLTLQLYFHDLESINGFQWGDYYMDGLRTLIAQFKKAPFLPIENEYINDSLDIYDVILVNLSVATVPGFPHSLAATLTLAEFDHEAYMPHVTDYGSQINYPLLRWYYQQCMDSSRLDNPYRTYLAPIEGKLTNDFNFKIAVEDELINRMEASKELRFLATPYEFDVKVSEGQNLVGRLKRDGEHAKEILGMYSKWLVEREKADYPTPERGFNKSSETFKAIYGEGFNFNDAEAYFVPKEWNNDFEFKKDYFFIRLEAESNINYIPQQYLYDTRNNMYRFTTSDYDIALIKKLVDNGNNATVSQKAYHAHYEEVRERAEGTEAELPMEDYFIDNILITQMNVVYENNFSMVQMQNAQNPTYQFLGSQDPRIEMTMETTDSSAVTRLRELMDLSERYSRSYRYGITSGFLGFENQLTRLFGVDSVMIEQCSIHTVPGFVDRFQIQLALCGFDKTQKRTESLSGFSGAYSTEKQDRYVKKDAVSKDAIIIDRKMKDLELYPDLELPTFEEINAVLPKINAGFQVYHNPKGAKFVDPDFYVSTNWTFRDYFKQFKENDGTDMSMGLMELEDFSGMVGKYYVNAKDPATGAGMFFEPSKEYAAMAENIDARTKNTAAQEFLEQQLQVQMAAAPVDYVQPNGVPLSAVDTGVRDLEGMRAWAKNIDNINTKPSLDKIAKWYGVPMGADMSMLSAAYNSLGTNPTPLQFYQELYSLIDELFVKGGYVFDERTSSSKVVKEKITYGRTGDVADAMYLWLKHSGDKRFANVASIKEPEVLKYADFNETKGMITRERMANILKSVFDLESDWCQFWEKGGKMVPKKNPTSTAVGIGQCMLYWHGENIDNAQRLAWDWKYNLRWSVRYFLGKYQAALKSDNIQVRCRPWDWAIRMYNWGSMPKDGNLFNEYFSQTNTIFQGTSNNIDINNRPGAWYNSPSNVASAPGQPMNNEIYSYLTGASPQNMQAMAGNVNAIKEAIRNPALALQFLNPTHASYIYYQDTLHKLDEMSAAELEKAYNIIMESVADMHGGKLPADLATWEVGVVTEANAAVQYQNSVKLLEANHLINTETPDKLWRDMFTDMMEYDQRGRMLRAFPTFQMFIIDEGRWMTNYKLWDNLYGFNAIESIDVHKSRKIAADTAVIRMSNVYSNLTSRRMEETYGDWSYDLIDNLFFGNPSQELMNARKELVSGMMLQTGARIHLRMGYGSDATNLPVMFNGTITELDTEDVVTIIAQGDGIELTNIISADPDESNDGGLFGKFIEPRDLLCNFLTSKGNWFRNAINNWTDGKFFKDNPLGIVHFGSPVKVPDYLASAGAIFNWYNDKGEDSMGEAVQNIYSSNGMNTFSQHRYQDGETINKGLWDELWNMDWPDNDELNIELKFYGQTVWDIAHALAYTSPDYITAVHPFEFRSTLFFGKPYYKMAYRYDSVFTWENNPETGITNWKRTVSSEYRKPYQQFHTYHSIGDIISNRIKASEEGVYTNVVARGRGKSSLLQQADSDIRFDKQKTKVIETNIITDALGPDSFWTIEKQLNYYAQSQLRDYMKDMYKGSLVVLGDPSVKPHDMCHIHDTLHDMNGPFLVKDVTHSFSHETGFITTISPDAVVVVDDQGTIAQATWLTSVGIGLSAYVIGKHTVGRGLRRMFAKGTMMRRAGDWSSNAVGKSMVKLFSNLPHDKNDVDFKEFKQVLKDYADETNDSVRRRHLAKLREISDKIQPKLVSPEGASKASRLANFSRRRLGSMTGGVLKNLSAGKNALAFLRAGSALAGFASFGVSMLVTAGLTFLTNTMIENQKRKRKARQAVMILPLQYQGRNFTAGLNGVAGAVVGTKPGKMDLFYMGAGYGGKDDWTRTLGRTLGWVTGQEVLPDDYDAEDMLSLRASYYIGKSAYGDGLEKIDNAYND